MAQFHATIVTPLTAPEAFDFIALFSNASQWDPGVRSARRLDSGAVGAGSQFRLTVPVLGLPLRLIYTVTRFQRPDEVVLEARNWLLYSRDAIQVTSGSDGAVVSYLADVRLRGPLAAVQAALTAGFPKVAGRAAEGLSAALSGHRISGG